MRLRVRFALILLLGAPALAAQQAPPPELEGFHLGQGIDHAAPSQRCVAGTFAGGLFREGTSYSGPWQAIPAHECHPTATLTFTLFSDTIGMLQQTLATVPVDSVSELWNSYQSSLTRRLGRAPDALRQPPVAGPLQMVQAYWLAADPTGWFAFASFQVLRTQSGTSPSATLLLGSCQAPVRPRPGLCTSAGSPAGP
jgi:hypothetical protein